MKILLALLAALWMGAAQAQIKGQFAYPPASGAGLTPGSTTLSACTANSLMQVDGSKVVLCDAKTTLSSGGVMTVTKSTAGDGLIVTNGGATPKSLFLYTDASAAGVFNTAGTAGSGIYMPATGLDIYGAGAHVFSATVNTINFPSAAASIKTNSKTIISQTAPTLASGGCTSAAMVSNNGTARFTAGVGTSCSGSQPLVFTLPATTTGWNCYAQNTSNSATSVPAQSSAISTTSVTITNYARTTGLAAAWTDADVIVVSCLGG